MTTEPYTPDAARWDAFVEWARRFYDWGGFREAERDYKVKIGERLGTVREAFLSDATDWRELLGVAFGPPNNLTYWMSAQSFQNFLDSEPDAAVKALDEVWTTSSVSPERRVQGFVEQIEETEADVRQPESLASFLLMAIDSERHPFYRTRPFGRAYRYTGYPSPQRSARRWERYGHAVAFIDSFIEQARLRRLNIPSRLDAQSIVWCLTQKYNPTDWPDATLDALRAYRESNGAPGTMPPDPTADTARPASVSSDWPRLARSLSWQLTHLEEIIGDLEAKRQMIFYGPPGTGKTYVAKQIAAEYRRSGGDFEIVQFHPSYSYEDFVEGFRPKLAGDGHAGFELTQGPLKRIAAKASANPEATHVLVIDELNRGNVAKVFGELYFLLEYRKEAITLQYSHEPFELPPNLIFICTMNTADRSIALVDAALRRRFWFEGFFPDKPPIEGLLRLWLEEQQPGAEWVADLVDLANQHLDDRDAAIGPSYFMDPDHELDDERVRRIWRRAVMPYVEEQCYGEDEKLRSLQYDRLLSELDANAPEAAAPPAGEDAANEAPDSGGEVDGDDDSAS
ncbi:MAG: AAA domain-containing protein [Chloroflexi bacterium]|nr:AAA domain-containing protein [Chloroflexota bacterium]